jgi:hypothetical protein
MLKSFLEKAKNNLSLCFGLFLVFIISTPFLFKGGYVAYVDLIHGPHTNYNWLSPQVLMNSFLYLSDFISPAFASRAILSLVLLLIYFAGRYLAKTFTDNQLTLTAGASFSVLNLFVYERVLYGQFGVVLAYAFLMLLTAQLFNMFKSRNFDWKDILLAGLFGGLAIDSSMHAVFMVGFVALVAWLFFGFRREDLSWTKSGTVVAIILTISLLVNSVWIYGAISGKTTIGGFVSSNITNQDLVAFQTSGNSLLGKVGNVVFLSGFWGKDQQRFVDVTTAPFWWVGFLPFIFLFVYGLMLLWRNDRKIFAWLLTLWAGAVTLSVASSVTWLLWIYKYVPFYSGLREPQKWVMVVMIVYLLLAVYALEELRKQKETNLLTYLFIFLLCLVQVRFFFGFWGQVRTFQFPENWYRLDSYLVQNISADEKGYCGNRTLVLPWHLYMSYPFVQKITANLAMYFFTCPVIYGTNMEYGGIFDNSVEGTRDPYGKWLFVDKALPPPKNIQFIILFKTVDWEKYLWLEENSYLQKIEDNADFVLYKVKI